MQKLRPLFNLALLSLASLPALGMDSTELLPARINSPAFKFGMVSGVDSKYSADGSVKTLNDINTVHFNSTQLAKIDSDVSVLVDALNAFSKQQQLGTQVDLGTMRIETEPTIKYYVPVYARGITNNFTLAGALPIISYQNKLRLAQSQSNVKAICANFQGSDEVSNACRKLDFGVVDATREKLVKLGYKPIQDRSETLLGDAQIVGLWRFYEEGEKSMLFRGALGLPTGKKDDADDLADIGSYGQTSFEPQFVANWLPHPKVRLAVKSAYKIVFPDSLDARVPNNADDVIPGPETKERLDRDIGDTATIGAAANYQVFTSLSIAGGYEYARKNADSYRGTKGQRYELLSNNSNATAHRLRAGITYDTIAIYQRTKTFPPLKFDFEVTNTVAGVNVDRQLVNELTFTMFF